MKFSDLANQLANASRLDGFLLVCGFDDKNMPAILVCGDDGCAEFTRVGFAAIGSGDMQALASLAFHDWDRLWSVDKAIYQVCAAKFMAEKTNGVGDQTIVLCLREDGKTKWIFKRHVEMIRKLWEKEGSPRIPSDEHLKATIEPILRQQQWLNL